MSIVASAAAWGLGEWNRMKEYAGSIPKGTMDCSFYQWRGGQGGPGGQLPPLRGLKIGAPPSTRGANN